MVIVMILMVQMNHNNLVSASTPHIKMSKHLQIFCEDNIIILSSSSSFLLGGGEKEAKP